MTDSQVYQQMVNSVREDADVDPEADVEDGIVVIQEDNADGITVDDWTDYPINRFYTIRNPRSMTEKWLRSRVIITPSAQAYNLDSGAITKWLHKNLPKWMYLTLRYIVFCADVEDDYDYLCEFEVDDGMEDFSEMLEASDLPDEPLLGVHWYCYNIVLVNVASISSKAQSMLDEGSIYELEFNDCNNYGVATTLIHEIRHLAQANPYIPEEILKQEDLDNEDDAEYYAREFYDEHPVWCFKEKKNSQPERIILSA